MLQYFMIYFIAFPASVGKLELHPASVGRYSVDLSWVKFLGTFDCDGIMMMAVGFNFNPMTVSCKKGSLTDVSN